MPVVQLRTLFLSFLKIGLTSFGGHAALVSVLQQELVKKRKLLGEEAVLDGLTIAAMLPGPLAVNVVTFVGYQLRGWAGALISMVAVLLPPTILIIVLAKLYSIYSSIEFVNRFLIGVIPAIIGVILSLCYTMVRKHVVSHWQGLALVLTLALAFFFHSYLAIVLFIAGGGLLGFLLRGHEGANPEGPTGVTQVASQNKSGLLIGLVSVSVVFIILFFWLDGLWHQLLFEFAKVSLTLFGGGYVMIPILHQIVVEQFQWLSSTEFAHAITFGQVTPGPILVSATYVGYVKGGFLGAFLATLGIFLPSAMVMVVVSSIFEDVKKNPSLIAVMKGIRPVIIGLIAYSGWILFGSLEQWLFSALVALLSFIVITFAKVNYLILILLAGAAGLLLL